MAYRRSTIPEWSLGESDRYFPRRSPRQSEPAFPQNGSAISATQRTVTILSKDTKREDIKMKLRRLVKPFLIAEGLQVLIVLAFSVFFSKTFWTPEDAGIYYYLGISYVYNVARTFVGSLLSFTSIGLTIIIYFMVFVEASCLRGTEKYPETIHDQVRRFFSARFLLKPFNYGMIGGLYCTLSVFLFDSAYAKILVHLKTSLDRGYDENFLQEQVLVVRLVAFLSGVEFFMMTYAQSGFTLDFPSTRAKQTISSLLDFNEFLKLIRGNFLSAFTSGCICFFLGPLTYIPFLYLFGIDTLHDTYIERSYIFMDLGLVIRIFVWTFLPKLLMSFCLKLANAALTELTDFPIEAPAGNNRCLLLNEAMKGPSMYLKYLAFYEFNMKADKGHPDAMVFFNITHPGNHPLNWRGVFSATCSELNRLNENIITFLQTVRIPAGLLQLNMSSHILNKLRREPTPGSDPLLSQTAAGKDTATENMRDLASTFQGIPNNPNNATLYDLAQQFPTALWNDLKDAFKGLLSLENINNLVLAGRFDSKLREKQVSNLLSDRRLAMWGMVGCMKLICVGLDVDKRGIVHQDIKAYIKKILYTYDTLSALEMFITDCMNQELEVDREAFKNSKENIDKMISTITYIVCQLNDKVGECYNILNIEGDIQARLKEIVF